MKGVFIHQGIEYRLDVAADAPKQGDTLPCTLSIKSHGAAANVDGLCLELRSGDPKDEADAGELVGAATLDPAWQLGAGEQRSAKWSIELDRNCTVSSKSDTLYFVYGASSAKLERLPVTVAAHVVTQAVTSTLESSYQFVAKAQKSSKGWTETKLKPPSARRFTLIDELMLGTRFEGNDFEMRFRFKVKKFDNTNNALGVKKAQSEFTVKLPQDRYLMGGGYVNNEALEREIGVVLAEVTPNI